MTDGIATRIRLFNAAFKLALEQAGNECDSRLVAEAIKASVRIGETDPAMIASKAVAAAQKQLGDVRFKSK